MKPLATQILIFAAMVGTGLFPGLSAAREIPYADAYAQLQAGKPMVLVFSATWCGPCQRLKAALRASDIPFAVWDIDHPPVASQIFQERAGIPFVSVWHRGALIARMGHPTVDQVASAVQAASVVAAPIPAIPPLPAAQNNEKSAGSAGLAAAGVHPPAGGPAGEAAVPAVAELKEHRFARPRAWRR